ncbi:VOC family protein, partial [Salmonella enterica subsp. enterica serovar Infantis]
PYAEPGPGGELIKQDDVAPVAKGVVIYLHNDDLLDSIERVVLAGGKCVLENMVHGDEIGTIGLFIDSEGNRIGLHQ